MLGWYKQQSDQQSLIIYVVLWELQGFMAFHTLCGHTSGL